MSTNATVEEKAAAPARRTFQLRSIRTRLLVIFVLLVLLPAVIIGVVAVVNSWRSGEQQAFNQLDTLATLKKSEIDSWVNDLQLDLNAEAVRDQGTEQMNALLRAAPDTAEYQAASTSLLNRFRQAIELRKNFEELFFIDLKGQVVLSSDTAQQGKVYDKQEFFVKGLKGSYVQPPFYATSLGRMSVIASQPVKDEQGQVVGVLAGRANISRLSQIMTQATGLGTTGEAYLVGSNSALLTSVRSGEKIGYVHSQGSARAIETKDAGSGLYDNYQGTPVLGAYRWLPGLQVALVAEQAQSEAFAATYATLGTVAGIALIAVLAAAVIGFVVTRGIANPLANLAETSAKIAGGDLTARAQAIASGDEIGVLATSFNAMADRVDNLLTGLGERSRELEASQRVAVAASERVSPDELLDLVVNLVRDQFNLYHVQVYVVDEEQAAAVLRQSTGFAGRQLLQKGHKIPLDRPALVTQAIREGQPVLVDDVSRTAGFLPNPLLPDTKSELVVPLKVGDKVIGALDAQDRTPGRFGQSTVALFQTMSNQISFLFENSQLLERTTAQTEALNLFTNQLRTAADIAHRLGAILDPERLLQQVVELMQSRFGLYHAHIYVLDEATGQLSIRAGSGEVGRVLRERGHSISLDAEKSLVARAARDRDTVLVNDTTLESDFMPNPLLPQTRSEVALPLVVGDKVLGVLDVQDDQAGRFTQAELDTFATLTGQIATSLQNASLFGQVGRNLEETHVRLDVSQALAPAQTEEEVLDAIMQHAGLYPQAQVTLFTFAPEAEERTLILRRYDPFESEAAYGVPIGTRMPASRFPLLNLITQDEPFVTANMRTDKRVDDATRELASHGSTATAVIPIAAGAEFLGVLVAVAKQEGYFDERKVHLYKTLAEQGAAALQSARLRDAMLESEERFRSIVEHSHGGIFTADDAFRFIYANDRMAEIMGYSLEELSGIDFRKLLTEESLNLVGEYYVRRQKGEKVPDRYEITFIRKDGEQRTGELSAAAARDAAGNVRTIAQLLDITERKQAERQVRTFQALAENSVDAIGMIDLEGRFTYGNRALYDLLGFDYEKGELSGESLNRFTPEDQLSANREAIGRAIATGGWRGEGPMRRKDGSLFETALAIFPVLDEAGQILSVAAIVRDVTERKQAEQAIRENEERQRQILDSMPVGTMVSRISDGTVLYANEGFGTLFGTSAAELVGKVTPDLYYDADDRAKMLAALRERGSLKDYELRGKRLDDGRMFRASVSIQPFVYGGEQVILAAFTDLTERLQAQAERERFTAQLGTAADVAGQVNSILDPDQLLNTVIPLLHDRFQLYHVHFYGLDAAAGELVLRAGYGEPGRIMLERGHKIPLDREHSLVARAARSKEAVLVNDVTSAPDFLPNPLLPETRSEVAVPAIAAGQVLGVFDVQQNAADYFTEADLDVFTTLTGQIATALQNASLFEEQKRVQAEVLREKNFSDTVINSLPGIFYLYDTQGRMVQWNKNYEQVLGYSAEEVSQLAVPDTIAEEDRAFVLAKMQDVFTQGQAAAEARILTKKGEKIPYYLTGLSMRVGDEAYLVGTGIDITERKRAEQELADTKVLMESAFEQTPIPMVLASMPDMAIRIANSASREFLGVQDEPDSVGTPLLELKQSWQDLDSDGMPLGAGELPLALALQGVTTRNKELRVRRKDGTERWELTNAGPIYNAAGELIAGFVAFPDITENKRAEQAVRESEEKFKALADNLAVGVFIHQDGIVRYMGQEAARLLGYDDTAKLLGRSIMDFIHPSERKRIGELARQRTVGQAVPESYETRLLKQDGSALDVLMYNTLTEYEGRVATQGAFSDITDRKRAEAERERFTTQLSTAADVASQVGSILDPDQLLNAVIPLLHDRFQLYHVHFYGLDATAGELVLRAGYGEPGRIMLERGHKIPLDREQSLVARAARTKEAVLVNDVTSAPDFLPNPLLPETRSEVAVPAIAAGQVLGVFDVQQNALNYFTEADLDVFTTLTGQIATALQNAGYVELVESRLHVSQALTGAQTEAEVVDALIQQAGVYPQASAALLLIDPTADELTFVSAGSAVFDSGLGMLERGIRFPITEFPLAQFLGPDSTFVSADITSDERIDPNTRAVMQQLGEVSEAFVPLRAGNEWLGVISAASKEEGYFDERRLRLYQTLAEQGAIALRTARLRDQVQESLTETRVRLDVSQALAPAQTEEGVLDAIIQKAGLYPQARVILFTFDPQAKESTLVLRREHGFEGGFSASLPIGTRMPASQFPLMNLITQDKPFVTTNELTDKQVDEGIRELVRRSGYVAAALMPMTAGGEFLGVLSAVAKEEGYFDEHKVHLYRTLAEQGAVALQAARLRDQVQESLTETRVRFEVSQALASAQTEEEVLDAVIQHAGIYPEARVTINLIDPAADQLTLVLRRAEGFGSGLTAAIPLGTRFTAKHVPLMQHVSPDTAFVSPNISSDERVDPVARQMMSQQGDASIAIMPITAGNEWLGVITASSKIEGYFDEDKLHLYRTLAEQGAVALHTARLYDETQRTSERLKEVDRLKSEFLANMSHELRTPLNSILGYTEVMLMGIDGEMDPETQADVQAIYDNGQHLLQLISDILDLAKIEAGRLNLNFETVDMRPLIDEIVTSTNGLLLKRQKSVEFNVEVAEDLPVAQVDRLRLNQILNNLLSNAVKFTEEGHITLRAVGDGDHLCFEVQDSGIGISSADQEKIFDQFRQADGSYKRRAEGTGLGLSITRHLVQMHGGTIVVHSRPGQGSTFTVRLPLKRQTVEQGTEAAAPSTGKGKGRGKAK